MTVRSAANRVLIARLYRWGAIKCDYSVTGDEVRADVSVTNAASYPIAEMRILLFNILEPSAPITRMPGSEYNVSGPDVVFLTYGSSKLFIANEQVARLLVLTTARIPGGIGVYLDTAQNWIVPPIMTHGPQRREIKSRSIPGHGSDQYSLSLRFAKNNASASAVVADLFRRWVAHFPPSSNWSDRRPIGQLILGSFGRWKLFNPKNPRYWWFVDQKVDINSEDGREQFKQRLLAVADRAVANLKRLNAQGVIVWDVEGEQFPNLQYVGDPRHLPPEMQPVVDEFFRRFTRSGLRCGLTLAVRKLMSSGATDSTFQLGSQTTRRYVDDPDELFNMLDQIVTYSNQRWGCTIYYVDADGNWVFPTNVVVFRRLLARHPGILFVPEHKTLSYYASTAPYCDYTLGQEDCPSAEARWIYPNAFSVIKEYEAPVRRGFTPMNMVERVRNGDVLLIESWVPSSNVDVRGSIDVLQRAHGSLSRTPE